MGKQNTPLQAVERNVADENKLVTKYNNGYTVIEIFPRDGILFKECLRMLIESKLDTQ